MWDGLDPDAPPPPPLISQFFFFYDYFDGQLKTDGKNSKDNILLHINKPRIATLMLG